MTCVGSSSISSSVSCDDTCDHTILPSRPGTRPLGGRDHLRWGSRQKLAPSRIFHEPRARGGNVISEDVIKEFLFYRCRVNYNLTIKITHCGKLAVKNIETESPANMYIRDMFGTMATESRVAEDDRHQFRKDIWAETS